MTNTLYMICNIDNFTLFRKPIPSHQKYILRPPYLDGIEKSIDENYTVLSKKQSKAILLIHERLDLFSAEHGLIGCTCSNDS